MFSLFIAEIGDYDPHVHLPGYVSEFRFVQHQVMYMHVHVYVHVCVYYMYVL